MKTIRIKNKFIGEGRPCFIVAEIGVNHNGSSASAKKMISAAKKAGADAVKFQTWETGCIMLKDAEMAEYQKKNAKPGQTQFEMIKKLELPRADYFSLKSFAEKIGLMFFSTMEDKESVYFLIKDLKIPFIKVGSGDLTNYPLLEYTAKFKKPMVLSTGTATMDEIKEAMKIVAGAGNNNIVLLQCTTEYPCPMEDVNLKAMLTLGESFKTIVGFSDHTLGIECSIAAAALGAKYLEKHFTLDRNLPGPDHKASLEPSEFEEMVRAIRNVEKAMGDGIKKPMPSELKNKILVVRKIVAGRDISEGEEFSEDNLSFKRAEGGLPVKHYEFVKNKKAKRNIKAGELIKSDDI